MICNGNWITIDINGWINIRRREKWPLSPLLPRGWWSLFRLILLILFPFLYISLRLEKNGKEPELHGVSQKVEKKPIKPNPPKGYLNSKRDKFRTNDEVFFLPKLVAPPIWRKRCCLKLDFSLLNRFFVSTILSLKFDFFPLLRLV